MCDTSRSPFVFVSFSSLPPYFCSKLPALEWSWTLKLFVSLTSEGGICFTQSHTLTRRPCSSDSRFVFLIFFRSLFVRSFFFLSDACLPLCTTHRVPFFLFFPFVRQRVGSSGEGGRCYVTPPPLLAPCFMALHTHTAPCLPAYLRACVLLITTLSELLPLELLLVLPVVV